MKCDTCGTEIKIGMWPFCDAERGIDHNPPQAYHPFKPYWDHMVAEQPVYVESIAQRRRLMKQNHQDYRGRKVGSPGCEI